jgi:hypothetical protein
MGGAASRIPNVASHDVDSRLVIRRQYPGPVQRRAGSGVGLLSAWHVAA